MEVSIGIYALFFIILLIFVPGVIARRAYYSGEFSKQFNWTNGGLNHFILSFFLGLLLSLAYIQLANLIAGKKISIEAALRTFDSYFIRQTPTTDQDFEGLGSSIYYTYLPVVAFLYLFSAMVGMLVKKIILIAGLDVRTKLFRYSNTWYYLFSGKILQLKNSGQQQTGNRKLHAKYTHLDVLVDEGEKRSLYSGLYFAYDLSYREPNKLERLYLLKTRRYKQVEGQTLQRSIPGEVFTIMGDRILNINATYVYVSSDEQKARRFARRHLIIAIITGSIALIYLSVLLSVLFSLNPANSTFVSALLAKSFWYKLIFLFWLNLAFSILTPFEINEKEKRIKLKSRYFLFHLLLVIVIGFLLYQSF